MSTKAWAVVAAVVAIALTVFVVNLRWIDQERPVPPSVDALRNQFLAAERFLARFDVPASTLEGYGLLEALPDPEEMIVLAGSRRGMSQRRVDLLIDWAARGGLLIVQAESYVDEDTGVSDDLLLETLGVRLNHAVAESVADALPISADLVDALIEEDADQCDFAGGATSVELEDEEAPIVVSLSDYRDLTYTGQYPARSADNAVGSQLISIDIGSGGVLVLTSFRLWTNTAIGCHDHAHLLRYLASDRAAVSWIYNVDMPSILVLIWRNFAPAVLLFALAILLWLWHGAVRSRRPRMDASLARREIVSHIQARARFAWQQGRGEALLAAMRRDVAGERVTAKQIAELAEQTDMTAKEVEDLLTRQVPNRLDAFLRLVRRLQQLRRATR